MSETERARHRPLTDFDQPALFDMAPSPRAADLIGLSTDARRTVRQALAIDRGRHPLSLAKPRLAHLKLHPAAAPATPRDAVGRRCGNCVFRQQILTNGNRRWPKCLFPDDVEASDWEDAPPRASRGAATDVRAWWPGCTDHSYGDPALSPDAARWPGDEPT